MELYSASAKFILLHRIQLFELFLSVLLYHWRHRHIGKRFTSLLINFRCQILHFTLVDYNQKYANQGDYEDIDHGHDETKKCEQLQVFFFAALYGQIGQQETLRVPLIISHFSTR